MAIAPLGYCSFKESQGVMCVRASCIVLERLFFDLWLYLQGVYCFLQIRYVLGISLFSAFDIMFYDFIFLDLHFDNEWTHIRWRAMPNRGWLQKIL